MFDLLKNLPVEVWFIIFLFLLYILYQVSFRVPKEKYTNYADAYLWPFDRVLLPIHYWLSQFYPNAYTSWYWDPYYGAGYWKPPGPWFQLTH